MLGENLKRPTCNPKPSILEKMYLFENGKYQSLPIYPNERVEIYAFYAHAFRVGVK